MCKVKTISPPLFLTFPLRNCFEVTFERHNGEKQNECDQCGYAFYWARQLRRHLKTHSGEKLNKCNQCDYASSYASTLRRQLKTHDGENSQQMHQEKHYISSSANTLKIHWKTLEENKLTKASGRKVQFHNLLPFFCGKMWNSFWGRQGI